VSGSVDVTRLVLGGIFLVAGAAKLVYGRRLVETLTLGGFVPLRLVRAARWLLPPAEFGVGIVLVLNPVPPLAGVLAAALLLAFSASAWSVVRSGGVLPCACFGGGKSSLDRGTIVRNAILVGYAVWAATSSRASLDATLDALRPHSGRALPLAIDGLALLLIPFVAGKAASLWSRAHELADEQIVERVRALPRGAA
jgi:uncharacterized membrane protein YphA (DoxX/SURF4 family)